MKSLRAHVLHPISQRHQDARVQSVVTLSDCNLIKLTTTNKITSAPYKIILTIRQQKDLTPF